MKFKKTTRDRSDSLLMKLGFLLCFCLMSIATYAQSGTVTGTIVDDAGDTMIGVNIRIQGTTKGTVTDLNGKYSIEAEESDILEFSYVGMQNETIAVGSRIIIDLVMKDDALDIKEVVVIGYGSARKRDLTGSIVSVKAEQFAGRPSANALSSIQGKVAGVQVINTGKAGQDPEIRVRGTNSVNGYKPLYVVDGLFTDNINYLNTADIESMEILKDPSSLAIFGIEGANGVIIITTKRAKVGQTLVNINSSIGFKKINDRIKLANAAQFKELYNQQLINQGAAKPFDYTNWQADTDWQDEIFQTALVTINNISITGASEKNRFYMGVGYMGEEGNIKTEKYGKLTVNLNSDYFVTDFLKFGFQVNGARMLPPDAKGVAGAVRAVPIAPVHAENGALQILPEFQRGQLRNPMVDIETLGAHNKAVNYRIAGNVYGELTILKDFKFRTTFSYDYGIDNSRKFDPIIYLYNPELKDMERITDTERVTQEKNTRSTAQSEYILTYNKNFGKHGLTATAGITTKYTEKSNLKGERLQKYDNIVLSIPNDNPDKWWLTSLPSTSALSDGAQSRRFTMSYLVRGLYSYDNRYLFNASFRRDGSSVFRATGNTWDNFYSFGAGWILTSESFMANQTVLDYLKIKGSWGVLGIDNTGDRDYPSYPPLTSSGSAVFGDEVITGYAPQYYVTDIGWEKVHAWEVGFELITLQQRLRIEPTYYYKTTKGLLLQVPGPSGAKDEIRNIGDMRNKGFELAITWNDKIGNSDFHYSIGGNMTTYNNEILELAGNGEIIDGVKNVARTTKGYPISYFYGYKVAGVYQNYADIDQSPNNTLANVLPGDLKFADLDDDGKITPADRTKIGNPTPDLTYGLNLNISYKNIDLGVDFMGVYGNEIYRTWDNFEFGQMNYLENRLDHWHGEGTSNWEPALDASRGINRTNSNYYIEDGSFLRLRNLQLGYSFHTDLLQKIYIRSFRVYANVQNLKTWKKNTGYTPEVGGEKSTKSGIDDGTYPIPAIFTFGINVTF